MSNNHTIHHNHESRDVIMPAYTGRIATNPVPALRLPTTTWTRARPTASSTTN